MYLKMYFLSPHTLKTGLGLRQKLLAEIGSIFLLFLGSCTVAAGIPGDTMVLWVLCITFSTSLKLHNSEIQGLSRAGIVFLFPCFLHRVHSSLADLPV